MPRRSLDPMAEYQPEADISGPLAARRAEADQIRRQKALEAQRLQEQQARADQSQAAQFQRQQEQEAAAVAKSQVQQQKTAQVDQTAAIAQQKRDFEVAQRAEEARLKGINAQVERIPVQQPWGTAIQVRQKQTAERRGTPLFDPGKVEAVNPGTGEVFKGQRLPSGQEVYAPLSTEGEKAQKDQESAQKELDRRALTERRADLREMARDLKDPTLVPARKDEIQAQHDSLKTELDGIEAQQARDLQERANPQLKADREAQEFHKLPPEQAQAQIQTEAQKLDAEREQMLADTQGLPSNDPRVVAGRKLIFEKHQALREKAGSIGNSELNTSILTNNGQAKQETGFSTDTENVPAVDKEIAHTWEPGNAESNAKIANESSDPYLRTVFSGQGLPFPSEVGDSRTAEARADDDAKASFHIPLSTKANPTLKDRGEGVVSAIQEAANPYTGDLLGFSPKKLVTASGDTLVPDDSTPFHVLSTGQVVVNPNIIAANVTGQDAPDWRKTLQEAQDKGTIAPEQRIAAEVSYSQVEEQSRKNALQGVVDFKPSIPDDVRAEVASRFGQTEADAAWEASPQVQQFLAEKMLTSKASGMDVYREIQNQAVRGAVGMATSVLRAPGEVARAGINGVGGDVNAEGLGGWTDPLKKIADWTDQGFQEGLPTDVKQADNWYSQLAQGAGSLAGFAGGGELGAIRLGAAKMLGLGLTERAAATIGTAALGGATNMDQVLTEAKEKGLKPEDEWKVGALAFGIGASEALPLERALSKIADPLKKKLIGKQLSNIFLSGLESTAEEGSQELFQGIANNELAQKFYDKKRGALDNTFAAAGVGGATGLVMGLVTGGLRRRQIGKIQKELSVGEYGLPATPTHADVESALQWMPEEGFKDVSEFAPYVAAAQEISAIEKPTPEATQKAQAVVSAAIKSAQGVPLTAVETANLLSATVPSGMNPDGTAKLVPMAKKSGDGIELTPEGVLRMQQAAPESTKLFEQLRFKKAAQVKQEEAAAKSKATPPPVPGSESKAAPAPAGGPKTYSFQFADVEGEHVGQGASQEEALAELKKRIPALKNEVVSQSQEMKSAPVVEAEEKSAPKVEKPSEVKPDPAVKESLSVEPVAETPAEPARSSKSPKAAYDSLFEIVEKDGRNRRMPKKGVKFTKVSNIADGTDIYDPVSNKVGKITSTQDDHGIVTKTVTFEDGTTAIHGNLSSIIPLSQLAESESKTEAPSPVKAEPTKRHRALAKILTNKGLSEEQALAVAQDFDAENPGMGLNEAREPLFEHFRKAGGRFKGEGAVANYSTDPEFYRAAGYTEEQISENVANAKAHREADDAAVDQANAGVAEALSKKQADRTAKADYKEGSEQKTKSDSGANESGGKGVSGEQSSESQVPGAVAEESDADKPGAVSGGPASGVGRNADSDSSVQRAGITPASSPGTKLADEITETESLAKRAGKSGGKSIVRVHRLKKLDDAKNAPNKLPYSVTPNSDGTISVFMLEHPGEGRWQTRHRARTAFEERIHLADVLVVRDEWVKAGKPGSFSKFYETSRREALNKIMAKARASEELQKALVDAYNLYFSDQKGDYETRAVKDYNELFNALRNASPGMQMQVMAELARQVVQLRKSGKLSDQTVVKNWLSEVKAWLKQALKRLKSLAKDPSLAGPEFDALITAIEARLDDLDNFNETTPPTPRTSGPSETNRTPAKSADEKKAEKLAEQDRLAREAHSARLNAVRNMGLDDLETVISEPWLTVGDLLDLRDEFASADDSDSAQVVENELEARDKAEVEGDKTGGQVNVINLLRKTNSDFKLKPAKKGDPFYGEMTDILKTGGPGMFRRDGMDIDRLFTSLQAQGMAKEYPDSVALLDGIQNALRQKEALFGREQDENSPAAKIAKDLGVRFDGSSSLGDKTFNSFTDTDESSPSFRGSFSVLGDVTPESVKTAMDALRDRFKGQIDQETGRAYPEGNENLKSDAAKDVIEAIPLKEEELTDAQRKNLPHLRSLLQSRHFVFAKISEKGSRNPNLPVKALRSNQPTIAQQKLENDFSLIGEREGENAKSEKPKKGDQQSLNLGTSDLELFAKAGRNARKDSPLRLFSDHEKLAMSIANKYRNIPGVDIKDLEQEARIGLYESAQSPGFDPEKGKFSTYAARVISNRLNGLYNKNSRRADAYADSMDRPAGEDSDSTVGDLVEGQSGFTDLFNAKDLKVIREEVAKLNPQFREIGQGLLAGKLPVEIADDMGLSRQRISQLMPTVLKVMRARLKDRGIESVEDAMTLMGRHNPPTEAIAEQMPGGVLIDPNSLKFTLSEDFDSDSFDSEDPTTWPLPEKVKGDLEQYWIDSSDFEKSDVDSWKPFLPKVLQKAADYVDGAIDEAESLVGGISKAKGTASEAGVDDATLNLSKAVVKALKSDKDAIFEYAETNKGFADDILKKAGDSAEKWVNSEPVQGELLGRFNEEIPKDPAGDINDILKEMGADPIPDELLKKSREKVDAEEDGFRSAGRPDLSIPKDNPELQKDFMTVDEAKLNFDDKQTFDGWKSKATEELSKDYAGVRRKLIEMGGSQGGILDAWETIAAQMIIEREEAGLVSGSDRSELQKLIWAYRNTGSEAARSLTSRRAWSMTPEQRSKMWLRESIFTPPDLYPAMKKAQKDGKTVEVKRLQKELQDRIARTEKGLARWGLSIEDLFSDKFKLVLKSAAIINEKLRGLDNARKQALRLLQDGNFDHGEIASKTGLTRNAVTKLQADIRAQVRAELLAKVRAGATVENLDVKGETVLAGRSEDDLTPAQEAEMNRILDAMGLRSPEDHHQFVEKKKRQAKVFKNKPKKKILGTTPFEGERGTGGTFDDLLGEVKEKNRIPAFEGPKGGGGDLSGLSKEARDLNRAPAWEGGYDPANKFHQARVMQIVSSEWGNWLDKLQEFYINSILSGPLTHATNIIGNTANVIWDSSIQRAMEASLNGLLNVASQGSKDAAQFGEMKHLWNGLRPSMAKAYDMARQAWDSEQDFSSHYMLNKPLQFDLDGNLVEGDGSDKQGPAKRQAIGGKTGRVIRMPGRALMFADVFTKLVTGRMNAGAFAYRQALKEGLKGKALENRVDWLVSNPGSTAWQEAYKKSLDLTFQAELPSLLNEAANLRISKPDDSDLVRALRFAMTTFFPFIKTPWNIAGMGIRKSPLGSIGIMAKAGMAAISGLKNPGQFNEAFGEKYSKAEFVKDLSEQLLAWGLLALLYGATEGDKDDDDKKLLITGGRPYGVDKQGQSDLLDRTTGGQYTVRLGGRNGLYFNYGRLDPLATFGGFIVDMIRMKKAVRDGATKRQAFNYMLSSFTTQAREKTFLAGFDELMKAAGGEGFDAKDFLTQRALGPLVPNLIKQLTGATDDSVRMGKDNIPYQLTRAGGLAPQAFDLYGNPIEKSGNMVSRLFVPPAKRVQPKNEKMDDLLARYNRSAGTKWAPERVQKDITINGQSYDLDQKELSKASEMVGAAFKTYAAGYAAGRESLTEDDIDNIKKARSRIMQGVKTKIVNERAK